ncbi:MAG: hypothetical protein BWZ10_01575 [candidate division BRC1 bacterium ADurb.BinA364]|nr:MAG: hypothetical protein BWZ10_01575 [candidate division BRC1 bacterium ADurb.BinA364]
MTVNGVEAPIQPKQFALLRELIQAAPRPVARHELLARVWKGRVVDDAQIQYHRKEIERRVARAAGPAAARGLIETVPGEGLRLAIPPRDARVGNA